MISFSDEQSILAVAGIRATAVLERPSAARSINPYARKPPKPSITPKPE